MNNREAMQQALEALESSLYPQARQEKAMTALRAALAEPDVPEVCFGNMSDTLPPLPEPARIVVYNKSKGYSAPMFTADQMRSYAAAALAAAVAEPVAWMDIDDDGNRLGMRQWSDGNGPNRSMQMNRNSPAVVGPVEPTVRPRAWAIFVDSGNARMWSTLQPHVQKLADAEGLEVTRLYDQAAIDAAVAAERERCARLCEGMHPEDGPHAYAWTIRTEWVDDSEGPNVELTGRPAQR